jgi:excisionase family DNA binding protein
MPVYDDIHEVAELLRLSEDRLRKKVRLGMIPYIRVGGKILMPHTAVMEYITNCWVDSNKETKATKVAHAEKVNEKKAKRAAEESSQ